MASRSDKGWEMFLQRVLRDRPDAPEEYVWQCYSHRMSVNAAIRGDSVADFDAKRARNAQRPSNGSLTWDEYLRVVWNAVPDADPGEIARCFRMRVPVHLALQGQEAKSLSYGPSSRMLGPSRGLIEEAEADRGQMVYEDPDNEPEGGFERQVNDTAWSIAREWRRQVGYDDRD